MKNMPDCAASSRCEIRIAGAGGQGIVLAGILLAKAALASGNYVAQTQNYGAETRGGSSVSDVVISASEVDYPKATKLDILVALTQEACDQNLPDMKEGGLVITDVDLVKRVLWSRAISLPLARLAHQSGEERAVNMAALGAVMAFCPMGKRAFLLSAMKKHLPSARFEANRAACEAAYKLAGSMAIPLEPIIVREDYEP